MKLTSAFPDQPPQRVDYSDMAAVTNRMMTVADELAAMSDDVAAARVIRESYGDRMKRALACAMRQDLRDGESAAKAEAMARSSDAYGKAIHELQEQLTTAEQVIQTHEAKRIIWESTRSALSTLKTIAGNLG